MINKSKSNPYGIIIFLTLIFAVLSYLITDTIIQNHYKNTSLNTLRVLVNSNSLNDSELVEVNKNLNQYNKSSAIKNILYKYGQTDNNLKTIPVIIAVMCLSFGALAIVFVYSNNKQYKTIFYELSVWAENIANGKFSSGYDIYGEGAFAVFVKQFSNMERSTQGMVNSLQKEKEHIQEFIANISHQLKTPLATLSLYEEMIYEDNKNNEIGEKSKVCLSQINRMQWLVNTLLKIAKFDASSIKLSYQKSELYKTIQHGADLAFNKINNTNVKISYNGDISCKIHHDPYWLAEAIENIIKNSLKWVSDNGNITITIEKGEALALINIEDNGGGFNSEDIPHLFDRFYTTNKNKSKKLKGVGIGLALVKAIVDAHNGNVKAYNGLAGAVFTISLPILEN